VARCRSVALIFCRTSQSVSAINSASTKIKAELQCEARMVIPTSQPAGKSRYPNNQVVKFVCRFTKLPPCHEHQSVCNTAAASPAAARPAKTVAAPPPLLSGGAACGAGAGAFAGAVAGATRLSPLMFEDALVERGPSAGPVAVTEMPGVSGGSGSVKMSLTGTGAPDGAAAAETAVAVHSNCQYGWSLLVRRVPKSVAPASAHERHGAFRQPAARAYICRSKHALSLPNSGFALTDF